MRRLMISVFVALALLIGVGIRRFMAERGSTVRETPRATVTHGPAEEIISEVGIIESRRHSDVCAPFREKLVRIVEEGTIVQAEEPVAWLETRDIERSLEVERSYFAARKADLEKFVEYRRMAKVRDELAVKTSEASLAYSQSALSYAERVASLKERLVGMRVLPRRDWEAARLGVDAWKLDVVSKTCALKSAQANWDTSQFTVESDIRYSQACLDMAQKRLQRAEDQIEKAVLKAPVPGLVVWQETWDWSTRSRIKIKEGEQVWAGQPIVRIPDMTDLYVRTQVNEIRISDLTLGIPARVRVDALNDLLVNATVGRISGLAIERARAEGAGFVEKGTDTDKVFELELTLGPTTEELKPGMTVSVELVMGRLEDAVTVPRDAVFRSQGQDVAYRWHRGQPEEVRVKLGFRSRDRVVIQDGLAPGDQVLLERP